MVDRVQSAFRAEPAAPRIPAGVWVVGGAACASTSGVFIKLAGVEAASSAFLRCVVLAPLAGYELHRRGLIDSRSVRYGLAAGAFLGIDYTMWTVSIFDVGAAIATVLANVQVIAFPVLARLFSGTPIPRRFLMATPVMLLGIALAGGTTSWPAAASERSQGLGRLGWQHPATP